MSQTPATPDPGSDATFSEALEALKYYDSGAFRNRILSRLSELTLLALSTAVAISGVLNPDDARIPAILGAVAVAVTSLRGTFHWRDNWIRFTLTKMALRGEIRLYGRDVEPYQDRQTKGAVMAKKLNELEMKDSSSWAALDTKDDAPPVQG